MDGIYLTITVHHSVTYGAGEISERRPVQQLRIARRLAVLAFQDMVSCFEIYSPKQGVLGKY